MTASLYRAHPRSRQPRPSWYRRKTIHSWRAPLRQAAEQQRRIAVGIDTQFDPAPFDAGLFAGEEIFECGDVAAVAADVDGDVAKGQPELAHMARECDGRDDGVSWIGSLLLASNR